MEGAMDSNSACAFAVRLAFDVCHLLSALLPSPAVGHGNGNGKMLRLFWVGAKRSDAGTGWCGRVLVSRGLSARVFEYSAEAGNDGWATDGLGWDGDTKGRATSSRINQYVLTTCFYLFFTVILSITDGAFLAILRYRFGLTLAFHWKDDESNVKAFAIASSIVIAAYASTFECVDSFLHFLRLHAIIRAPVRNPFTRRSLERSKRHNSTSSSPTVNAPSVAPHLAPIFDAPPFLFTLNKLFSLLNLDSRSLSCFAISSLLAFGVARSNSASPSSSPTCCAGI